MEEHHFPLSIIRFDMENFSEANEPQIINEIGFFQRLHGLPQRVLVTGPALDKVELEFSTNAALNVQESDHLQPLQPEGEALGNP